MVGSVSFSFLVSFCIGVLSRFALSYCLANLKLVPTAYPYPDDTTFWWRRISGFGSFCFSLNFTLGRMMTEPLMERCRFFQTVAFMGMGFLFEVEISFYNLSFTAAIL